MASLWTELKRRNVVRVGMAYVLVAWVVLQIVDFSLDLIDGPNWIMQLLFLLAVLGLPAVLLFAWVFELTPEGIKRESEIDRSTSVVHDTGRKLNFAIIGVLVLIIAVLLLRQFSPDQTRPVPGETAQLAKSIAVLPFEDYSEAGDQEHFSKGIAEEILNLLAKTDALRVAARTSSFAFSGEDQDIREIGQKLDVGVVLEGSIRKSGDMIRITAQLINVDDGYHIWSETYDRAYEDIFKIQDEIADSIMGSLRVHLLGEDQKLLVSERSTNVDAYSAYLIGKERMALLTQSDLEAARTQFEKSIGLDPEYAPALVQLAHTWLLLEQHVFGGEDIDQKQVDETIVPLLDKALLLAPDLPEAVATKAYHDYRRYRTEEAGLGFNRAIELNPNYALAYTRRAEIAYEQERYLDMLADKEKAYALDPMSLEIAAGLAAEYRNFWRPQDAERVIDRMFDLHPGHPLVYQAAIANLANHGRYGEALLMMERSLKDNPDDARTLAFHNWGLLFLGMIDESLITGDDEIRLVAAMLTGDYESAASLLEKNNADGKDINWNWGALQFANLLPDETGRSLHQKYLTHSLEEFSDRGIPWQEQCRPYLINDLRISGREEETSGMMEQCRRQVEERFKAKYLCPCSWFRVVQYSILAGREDEAIERARMWLNNGDSSFDLEIDSVFSLLSDRPEYSDLIARNAAQIERQRDIYLAGTERDYEGGTTSLP